MGGTHVAGHGGGRQGLGSKETRGRPARPRRCGGALSTVPWGPLITAALAALVTADPHTPLRRCGGHRRAPGSPCSRHFLAGPEPLPLCPGPLCRLRTWGTGKPSPARPKRWVNRSHLGWTGTDQTRGPGQSQKPAAPLGPTPAQAGLQLTCPLLAGGARSPPGPAPTGQLPTALLH